MGLLAIALVAGQANAGFSADRKATNLRPASDLMPLATVNIVYENDENKKFDSAIKVIDTLLSLPAEIEFQIDSELVSDIVTDAIFDGREKVERQPGRSQ